MPSTFNVHQASGYEQLMGRWSRRLAPHLIGFAGIEDGDRVIDVGCGTGSLTFALAESANVAEIHAVDIAPVFVEEVRRRNSDTRITVQWADASALPYEADYFDRAFCLLVLHFTLDPALAVAEMARVVRPGGSVAAAVWDHYGGMPGMRMMWDTVAATSPAARKARDHYLFQPMTGPGELERCFAGQGLRNVVQSSVTIRMDYTAFADYWSPIAAGEGPLGKFVSGLDAAERPGVESAVRAAYEGERPDGPRSFAALAWMCRGLVA